MTAHLRTTAELAADLQEASRRRRAALDSRAEAIARAVRLDQDMTLTAIGRRFGVDCTVVRRVALERGITHPSLNPKSKGGAR